MLLQLTLKNEADQIDQILEVGPPAVVLILSFPSL